MFCTNCGREIADNAAICVNCGVEVGKEKKFCANCGKERVEGQVVCIGCGCPLQAAPAAQANGEKIVQPGDKSALLATLLSCFIPGVGQIYLGQVTKGIVLLIVNLVWNLVGQTVLWIIVGLTFGLGIVLVPVLFIPWLVILVDTYMIGKKLEDGKSVGEWKFF